MDYSRSMDLGIFGFSFAFAVLCSHLHSTVESLTADVARVFPII
jgi:hypothetical protein